MCLSDGGVGVGSLCTCCVVWYCEVGWGPYLARAPGSVHEGGSSGGGRALCRVVTVPTQLQWNRKTAHTPSSLDPYHWNSGTIALSRGIIPDLLRVSV